MSSGDSKEKAKKSANKSNLSLERAGSIATLIGVPIVLFTVIMPEVKALWGLGWFWTGITLAVLFVVAIVWLIAVVDPKRETNLDWLEKQQLALGYHQRLRGLLAKADGFLSKDIKRKEHKLAYFWSADLLGFCLLLAIAYPLFSLLLQWLLTGEGARLGNAQIFLPITSVIDHLFSGGLVLFIIFLGYRARSWRGKKVTLEAGHTLGAFIASVLLIEFALTGEWAGLAIGLIVGTVLFFLVLGILDSLLEKLGLQSNTAFTIAFFVTVAVAGAGAVAFAGAFAVAGAGAVAFAGAFAVAGASAGAVVGAGAVAVAGAVAGAVVGAVAGAVVGAVAGAVVGAVAGAVAVAFIIIIDKSHFKNTSPARLLLFVLIAFFVLLGTVVLTPLGDDLSKSLLLFLGFLPLINAVFDYLSIGLTRYLLQNSLDSGLPWIRGLLDAVAAIILFVLLKLTLVTLFVLLTDSNNSPLIQLGGDDGLFQGLRTDPNGYIWLYFTLFSTLIPTFFHLTLSCFTLAVTNIKPLPNWLETLAKWLKQADEHWLRTAFAFVAVCLLSTLFIVGPMAALSHLGRLIWGGYDNILLYSLEVAEQWANYVQNLF